MLWNIYRSDGWFALHVSAQGSCSVHANCWNSENSSIIHSSIVVIVQHLCLGCTKCWTQCSELDKWTPGLCGEPPHLFQSTQAVCRESNNFSFSSWKGLPSASVIPSVQWSLPFLPPHTSLSEDMHLRRGSAGSSASYLDDQCHIKTPLSSNYIVW